MTITKEELNSTTELFEIALNDMFNNCHIKVRTGLIKDDYILRVVEQKTLGDFCEDFGEGAVKPPTDYYVTIHPAQLQRENILSVWRRITLKIQTLSYDF